MGDLYQLRSKRELTPGDYVKVNGPYDTYGRVQVAYRDNVTKEGTLYLIRGKGKTKPHADIMASL